VFHGQNMAPEIRFPYGNGTPVSFPAPDAVGIICKRQRKDREMEFIPSKAADLAKVWEYEKKKDIVFAWKPWRTKVDVLAFVVAGDTVFYAGPAFDPKTEPAPGELRAFSMKDGQDLGWSVKLATSPVYDGLSTAGGRLFVSLQDGTLPCWAGKK